MSLPYGGPFVHCGVRLGLMGRTFLMIAITASGLASCRTTQPQTTVLFMCPYGGAKSVIAASYFNRIATERGLPWIAIAAAAEEPYDAVPPQVAAALERDGFDVRAFKPRPVAPEDLRNAAKVVAIDCDLTKVDANGTAIESWTDVPKVSADLPGSIASIRRHVDALFGRLPSKD